MNCPDCNAELVMLSHHKQSDGTIITDYRCPGCGSRFADMTIPVNAVAGGGNA
jgi:transposase-like protein